jgi:hypothetical protein
LKSGEGATFNAVFIQPENPKIDTMGNRIHVSGGDEFFVICTLQEGRIPELSLNRDNTISVYNKTIKLINDGIVIEGGSMIND